MWHLNVCIVCVQVCACGGGEQGKAASLQLCMKYSAVRPALNLAVAAALHFKIKPRQLYI